MSDTFDHEGDAWQDYERSLDEGSYFSRGPRRSRRIQAPYRLPPSYTAVPVVNHLTSTDKAHLVVVEVRGGHHEVWVAKSKCIFDLADMIQIEDYIYAQLLKRIETNAKVP